jgi:hypothetical protein
MIAGSSRFFDVFRRSATIRQARCQSQSISRCGLWRSNARWVSTSMLASLPGPSGDCDRLLAKRPIVTSILSQWAKPDNPTAALAVRRERRLLIFGGGELAVCDVEEVVAAGQLAEKFPGTLMGAVVGGIAALDPELHGHGAVA